VQIALAVVFVMTVIFAVRGYPSGYGALSKRSRLYRTAALGLLILLIIVAFVGFSLPLDGPKKLIAFRQISILLVSVMLALSLVCAAGLDALESYSVVRRQERLANQKVAEELQSQLQGRKEREPLD
jgi:membrane protease YdiL (CAAX protease family)